MKRWQFSSFLGPFLFTAAGLFMVGQYIIGSPFSMWASLAFLIGIIMIMNRSSFLAISDSSLKVRQEIRAQQARRAHHLHHRHIKPKGIGGSEYGIPHIAGLLAVIVALLLPANYWVSLIFMGAALVWMVYAGISRNYRDSFWVQLFFFVVVFVWATQGTGTTLTRFNDVPMGSAFRAMVSTLSILFTALSTLFVVRERRSIGRNWVRNQLITLTVGYSTVLYMTMYPNNLDLWIKGLLALGVWYILAAAASWFFQREYSYAKYFSMVGLVLLYICTFQLQDPVYGAMFFFGLTVVVFAAGFAIPSYTARMAGLITGAMFVSMYFLYVSPSQWMYENEAAVAGLGLVAATFMLMVSQWYRLLPKRSQETPYLKTIESGCVAAALLTLMATLINSSLIRSQVVFLGIVLGLGTVYLGKKWSLPLFRILGGAIVAIYLISISFGL